MGGGHMVYDKLIRGQETVLSKAILLVLQTQPKYVKCLLLIYRYYGTD